MKAGPSRDGGAGLFFDNRFVYPGGVGPTLPGPTYPAVTGTAARRLFRWATIFGP
jgi:hypothetical protein